MSYPYDKPGMEWRGGYRGALTAFTYALAFALPWLVGVAIILVWIAERVFS